MVDLESISARLGDQCRSIAYAPPAAWVYHPLSYAWEPHVRYLRRWGGLGARALLVGMNPGPFGMAQTGVPFGDVPMVRDWIGVEAAVGRPEAEHPSRRVEGFSHRRREGSGRRLWGWAQSRFGTPEAFFSRFFVHNWCPVLFLDEGGRNLTPDKLRREDQSRLEAVCDAALADVVRVLGVDTVIGVGAFAEARARVAVGDAGVRIVRILHPSPASPAANRDWAGQVEAELGRHGLLDGAI